MCEIVLPILVHLLVLYMKYTSHREVEGIINFRKY